MEHCLAMKKSTVFIDAATWMNLKMLSKETRQKKSTTYYNIIHINYIKPKVIYSDRSQISGCLGMEKGI